MKYILIPNSIVNKVEYAEQNKDNYIECKDMEDIYDKLIPALYSKEKDAYNKIHGVAVIDADTEALVIDDDYSIDMSRSEYEVYILGIL